MPSTSSLFCYKFSLEHFESRCLLAGENDDQDMPIALLGNSQALVKSSPLIDFLSEHWDVYGKPFIDEHQPLVEAKVHSWGSFLSHRYGSVFHQIWQENTLDMVAGVATLSAGGAAGWLAFAAPRSFFAANCLIGLYDWYVGERYNSETLPDENLSWRDSVINALEKYEGPQMVAWALFEKVVSGMQSFSGVLQAAYGEETGRQSAIRNFKQAWEGFAVPAVDNPHNLAAIQSVDLSGTKIQSLSQIGGLDSVPSVFNLAVKSGWDGYLSPFHNSLVTTGESFWNLLGHVPGTQWALGKMASLGMLSLKAGFKVLSFELKIHFISYIMSGTYAFVQQLEERFLYAKEE